MLYPIQAHATYKTILTLPLWEAYFVQDKAVQGCEVDPTSKTSSVRQVHVIELHSASHELLAMPPRVIVDLTPIMRGKEHLYNVVLVLKADVAVSWDIRSVTVSGKLEILVCIYICYIHIQISPTGCIGLILRSTTVATARWSTFQGTMRVLWHYCDRRYHACSTYKVPYPSSYSGTVYVKSTQLVKRNLDVYLYLLLV